MSKKNTSFVNQADTLSAESQQGTQSPSRHRKVLLVARISSVGREATLYLAQLFRLVVRQIENRDFELPDFEDVVHAYENPTPGRTKVFQAKRMRAVLIEGTDCDVLLSLGGARALDEKGDNAYVEKLVEVLDAGDYDKVVTTTISRLCRNTILAGEIQRVLDARRTAIQAGPNEVKVWTLDGKIQWPILVAFAELEAQHIETRLTAGKIAQAEKGEWNFGYAPPPGWRRREDKTVEVDPVAAEAVRWTISQVLAGESNWRELARQVTRRWPELTARRGGGKLKDSQEPGVNLRRSYLNETWFEAYATDQYEAVFVPNAVKHRRKRAIEEGRNPNTDDTVGNEEVSRVVFQLPPQPQPLATRAEIEQLRDRLVEVDEQRPGRRRTGTSLWTGLRWSYRQVTVGSDSNAGEGTRPDETEAA